LRRISAGALAAVAIAFAGVAPAQAENLGTKGGFTYVKKESNLPNGPGPESADATATCPSGTVRTGGGGTVTGKLSGTYIASSGTATDKQWYVDAWHTGINPDNETVTAWGVCTDKAEKVSSVTKQENVGAGPAVGTETAECALGSVVGGGVRVIGPTTNWAFNSTGPVDSGDDGFKPDDGWVSWVEHSGPPSSMIVDAVCMWGKEPKYRFQQKETTKKKIGIRVFCPKGTSATGGGAFASGAVGDAHIVSSNPIDSKKDVDQVPDDGWKAKYFNEAELGQGFTASVACK
jgi:hypothetical protein